MFQTDVHSGINVLICTCYLHNGHLLKESSEKNTLAYLQVSAVYIIFQDGRQHACVFINYSIISGHLCTRVREFKYL
jgi:hypothetical protein